MAMSSPHEKNGDEAANERLSAYFDGELSSDERAVVENLLENSDVSRRELNEIAQLSALLHSFPRESAPTELASRIREQTDKLPITSQKPSAVPSSVRSLRREWFAAGLGAAITAASLMLMANFVERNGSFAPQSVSMNDTSFGRVAVEAPVVQDEQTRNPLPKSRDLSERRIASSSPMPSERAAGAIKADADNTARTLAASDALPRDKMVPAESEPPAPSALMASKKMGSVSDAPSLSGLAGKPAVDSNPESMVGNEDGIEGISTEAVVTNILIPENSSKPIALNNGDFLNGLRQGELLQPAIQVADSVSNVGVVDLTVVDIERGLTQTRLLLERNSIPLRTTDVSAKDQKQNTASVRNVGPAADRELVVVYLVAPGEQVARTLEEMERHPELFKGWSSQPPVQLNTAWIGVENESMAAGGSVSAAKSENGAGEKSSTAKENVANASADGDVETEANMAVRALLARGNSGINYTGNTTLASNGDLLQRYSNFNLPADAAVIAERDGNYGNSTKLQTPSASGNQAKNKAGASRERGPGTLEAKPLADNQSGNRDPAMRTQNDGGGGLNRKAIAYQTTIRLGEAESLSGADRGNSSNQPQVAPAGPLVANNSVQRFETQARMMKRSDNVTGFRAGDGSNSAYNQSRRGASREVNDVPVESREVKLLFVLHPMPTNSQDK